MDRKENRPQPPVCVGAPPAGGARARDEEWVAVLS